MVAPAADLLATRLVSLPGLRKPERDLLVDELINCLDQLLRTQLGRTLLIELHIARIGGRLGAAEGQQGWERFVELSATSDYWLELQEIYPAMRGRVDRMVSNRVDAVVELAQRLTDDRARLADYAGADMMTGVSFGAGDTHRDGRTVARVDLGAATVWYKPRPVEVDVALRELVRQLDAIDGAAPTFGVPAVLSGAGYGWAEHVEHRYCADPNELRTFYSGMGAMLAVMALLNGTDLHLENVIACGPLPVIVDCETLFTPGSQGASPFGKAFDTAVASITPLLRTMLLPLRESAVRQDMSGLGGLPGEQPKIRVPGVEEPGTDQARVVIKELEAVAAKNLPAPQPNPGQYWEALVGGYQEYSKRIDGLDSKGELDRSLRRFAGRQLRLVPRATDTYVNYGRALWHPAGLKDQAAAVAEASELMARYVGSEPPMMADAEVIAYEIGDLLCGDVPVFTFTPDTGTVHDGNGRICAEHSDLIEIALRGWRKRDRQHDKRIIGMALLGAHRRWDRLPSGAPTPVPDRRQLDRPMETSLAAKLVSQLCQSAIFGTDGTATWMTSNYLSVSPAGFDLYSGLPGITATLAAYAHRAARGDAPHVRELDETLAGAKRSLHLISPAGMGVGGYSGLGGLLWTWLLLHHFDAEDQVLDQAILCAKLAAEVLDKDDEYDIIGGAAGLIVPVLGLATRTGDRRHLALAERAGEHLRAGAIGDEQKAHWPTAYPDGLGGFAHGSAGIGWALARLALATGNAQWTTLAGRALRHTESTYDATQQAWIDMREVGSRAPTMWCHGSAGIGLAAADLHRRDPQSQYLDIFGRAHAHTQKLPPGRSHAICHGDYGNLELLNHPLANLQSGDRQHLIRTLTHQTEVHGPLIPPATQTPLPGMMNGIAGLIYQLLRSQDAAAFPSVLLLESADHLTPTAVQGPVVVTGSSGSVTVEPNQAASASRD
ncbi:type 2 lanthipeptide synthetase LanM family protein [Catellatospora sp. NPDC049609]|uniref:type 2 lanthipeptide synthetase LanM family protein n=1 Tax=Catellatospora sp. NPDC049609 TaxID=3155505 RepID=UPI003421F8D6